MIKLLQLLLVSLTLADLPPFIKIQGFLRDFSCSHPDFEPPVQWCREQKRLLQPQLKDNMPVMKPPQLRSNTELGLYTDCADGAVQQSTKYALSNFGQFYHEEYYVDVPGVNIAYPIELKLNLNDSQKAIYSYYSDNFFPLNGKGYVRENLNNGYMFSTTGKDNNYWFTSEYTMRFYYKGGEVFEFIGDDDLWVYINDKLTPCDLGGIHAHLKCSIVLDQMNLLKNLSYVMRIFHAERHTSGSTFQISTSIVPINLPPIATNGSVLLLENSNKQFTLAGYDPDYNPTVTFVILSNPSNGVIDQPLNKFMDVKQLVQYTPNPDFVGQDTFTYLMNDGQANSSIGVMTMVINSVHYDPIASDQSVNVNADQNLTVQLAATDHDTPLQDLKFTILSSTQNGYVVLGVNGEMTYAAVQPGSDVVEWMVSDGVTSSRANVTITIGDKVVVPAPPLESGQVAGIVIGGFAFFALIGFIIAWLLYWHIASVRFQQQQEKEFYESLLQENPLYKPASKESFNPLYSGK